METLSSSADSSSLNPTGPPLPGVTRLRRHESRLELRSLAILVADVLVLGWVGASPPEGAFIVIGRLATAYYFLHFLILLPVVGKLESPKPLPDSLAAAVLKPDSEVATQAGSP